MRNRSFLLPFFFFSLLFVGCKKNNPEDQAKEDDAIIKEYISKHSLSAVATGSGLYVVIENPGNGASCDAYSDVKVAYKGYFTDGNVFDESPYGIEFNLQGVIKGWTEGIPYFKEGGKGKLLVPSALGYGDKATGSIPANSVLIFDVELLDVL